MSNGYESEHTQYMRAWLASHPEECEVQRQGRALWWDKPPRSLDDMRRDKAADEPQKAYPYDVNNA